MSIVLLIAIIGWWRQDFWYYVPDEGLGYWLGIIGGIILLFQAFYPLRKRFVFLRELGRTKYWFGMHMLAGVIAPVVLLFHSNYKLGSFNGRIALFAMLAVAVSGLVGRYFYIHIHSGLFGRRKRVEQLIKQWEEIKKKCSFEHSVTKELELCMGGFERPILDASYQPVKAIIQLFFLKTKGLLLYLRIKSLIKKATNKGTKNRSRQEIKLEQQLNRTFKRRIRSAIELAEFNGYERLFSIWHVIHIPFFIVMLLCGVVHVLAVHMY